MKKQITYTEPIPQFEDGVRTDVPTTFTVIANTHDEYDAHMAAITNPARRISDIAEEDLPEDEVELSDTDAVMLAVMELAEKTGVTLETLPETALRRMEEKTAVVREITLDSVVRAGGGSGRAD